MEELYQKCLEMKPGERIEVGFASIPQAGPLHALAVNLNRLQGRKGSFRLFPKGDILTIECAPFDTTTR